MARIAIGKDPSGRNVYADLDILSRTRALIQANSGGGKSYLIRRMAEQIFGKMPEFIVDEEGEFPSLRSEKFPFVLVGKGGDTPADPRSAQLLAHRLLEHRASAIFDLSELKPQVRHHWVRLFFEALVESPRSLWTPVVVFLDEAHHYAPEKGDSEARSAVVDAATRGRKRGICLIPATQRLAKLSKDVTGELLNRFIGPTFEDLDIDRAADLLSIGKAEKAEFAKAMRVLAPGNFQLLGRAFGTERIQVKVGPVETKPPELGRSRKMHAPPPPPGKIRAFLPKLADLPKEAEEKAKNEAELRTEIRSLKAQLTARPKETVEKVKTEVRRVEIPIIKPAELVRLESVLAKALQAAGRYHDAANHIRGFSDKIQDQVRQIEQRARAADRTALIPTLGGRSIQMKVSGFDPEAEMRRVPLNKMPRRDLVRAAETSKKAQEELAWRQRADQKGKPLAIKPRPVETPDVTGVAGDVPKRMDRREIAALKVLAVFPEGCQGNKLALLAGYCWGGGFRNALSTLRTRGFIAGGNQQVMQITAAGLHAIADKVEDLPQGRDLVEWWCNHRSFDLRAKRALRALLDNPEGLTGEALAQAAGYTWGGGFRNCLSTLRTAGVIEGSNQAVMKASKELLEANA